MTKQILVGGVPIGGGAPVSIQSMLNTKTTDVDSSLRQLRELADAGCQIARLAVPDMDAAKGFAEIASASPLPLVADIHSAGKRRSPSASASTAGASINGCSKNTAIRRRRRWSKARFRTSSCLKNTAFTTSACR